MAVVLRLLRTAMLSLADCIRSIIYFLCVRREYLRGQTANWSEFFELEQIQFASHSTAGQLTGQAVIPVH
jgi:hypothetical protein